MSNDPTPYEAATAVLIAHQRHTAASCLCGWAELGRSHAEHVAAVLADAGVLLILPAAVPPPPETPRLHDFRQVEEDLWACLRCGAEIVAGTTVADGEAIDGSTCPVPAAPPETPEPAPEHWRDDPTGWERTGEGVTSYGTDVVWSHPSRGSQVVSLGIERAIRADAVAELPREEMDEYRLNSLTEELAEVNADYRRLSEELTQARAGLVPVRDADGLVVAYAERPRYTETEYLNVVDERDAARAEAEEMRAALVGHHEAHLQALIFGTSAAEEWGKPCLLPACEALRARQSPQEGK